ncbi:putative methyltransferase-domain-containing protein [Mycena floridula]|nr:putative methyltransferase-domain-containing protein [Mycena floridula]
MSSTALLVNLGEDSEQVVDADEEVFLLYTDLQATTEFRGLGHLDSKKDIIELSFEIKSPVKKNKKQQDKNIEIQLAQDKTGLRSRKGDTGSVIWKASIDFAQLVLQQAHFPAQNQLFDYSNLDKIHLLELGAGTGLLSIVLSPFVARYTVTDIAALMPLIRKNITLNASSSISKIQAEELDWLVFQATPQNMRPQAFNFTSADILLVVDCIYHPALLPALVETIDFLTVPDRTTVLVVVELRAEDVIRTFLELWLSKPGWQIWRLGRQGALPRPYVMWAGIKKSADLVP